LVFYNDPLFKLFLGEPLPTVLWYFEHQLLDSSYQQTSEATVVNSLTIPKLERHHAMGKFRCLAGNNNISKPAESSMTVKMICKYFLLFQEY
jgi:hypothetical protein